MATDRLTRQELSWLLAQEARSAADLLRKGVTGLKVDPGPVIGDMSSTLDALDDAMKTLATLQTGGQAHSRRGRIDVAALLLELAPGASISFEPGEGTEVFGDESELRRILQVLVSLGVTPSGAAAAEPSAPITVRRVGEAIKIMVALGPDSSVASRMEQAWLHRMAVRHGGKLELEGGQVTLEIPADAGDERREVQELRRELAAAQEQGEAYARELASMFAKSESTMPPPVPQPSPQGEGPSELVRLCRALGHLLRPEVLALGKTLAHAENAPEGALARVQAIAPAVDDLQRFGQAPTHEPPSPRELGSLVRGSLLDVESRADRRGVSMSIEVTDAAVVVRARSTEALCHLLASQAVEVTPRGGKVTLKAALEGNDLVLSVEDGGPAIPVASREPLLSLEIDGSSLGRPQAFSLFLAVRLARSLGGSLAIDDGERGGVKLSARVRMGALASRPGGGLRLEFAVA